jgi:hypothetical protein
MVGWLKRSKPNRKKMWKRSELVLVLLLRLDRVIFKLAHKKMEKTR